jgi:hypothetical protein
MNDTLHPVVDPAEFDVEEFLQDARLPEESVTVYKRPDVIAELSDLKRRIQLEDRLRTDEQSAAEMSLTPLEQEYEALLQTFSRSAVTVYVRAIPDEEIAEQRKLTEERTKGMPPQDANLEFGYDLLARAIIGMKPAGGERKPVTFTPAKIKTLRKAIGDTQVDLILKARQIAQNAMPSVDADFLLRHSGEEAGSE